MGKCLIIRKGGGGADCTPYINELAISQGLLAYSNLILSADHANDLDNGKSFGFDNDNTVQYKALKGTYSESVIVNPSSTDTILVLNTTVGLNINDEYTLQDVSLKENVIIQSIDSGTVVTLTTPLVNSYTSAYLYDYYVGNPVGVVDYDFRADVLANGTVTKKYSFNGTTSKAVGTGGSAFNLNTWVLKGDFDITGGSQIPVSFNNDSLKYFMTNPTAATGDLKIRFATEHTYTGGVLTGTNDIIVIKHNGTTYDIYLNGTKLNTASAIALLSVTKVALSIREGAGDLFADCDLQKLLFTSTTLTDQQALDMSGGIITVASLLTEANSEVFYEATQDTSVTIIENLGTTSGYDLTSTAVTLIDGGIIPPFTPMDLITQSYTLTNASGATLQHFAKFGTGAYNLMTETSTDHFSYENSTEEDNIKIKTTVVGDTSQLLDIQLELGGVSNV